MAEGADPESKTEEATPRKLEEARKKGDVAKSQDVGQVLALAGAASVILGAGGWFAGSMAEQLLPFIAAPHQMLGMLDSESEYLDGSRTYKCTLPAGIPQANFWSMTVYDNQTRSMLQTDQRYPRAGSQSYPTPAAVPNEDGSIDVYFGPEAPDGKESNWIQTIPGRGWFAILRLYSPLQSFFDKTWRAGEIEPID